MVMMSSWDAIEPAVAVVLVGTRSRALPDTEELDRFESSTGFLLPLDYRDYALTFGLGRFGPTGYQVAVPGFLREDEYDLRTPTAMTEFVREGFESRSDEDLAEEYDDPGRARRLVVFCGTDSNDYWGWDPEDVTDPAAREYGIYQLGRYDTRVLRVARTFRDFLLDIVFEGVLNSDGSGTGKLPASHEEDDYPPTRFVVSRARKVRRPRPK
jgi:hypothetical protein